MTKQAATESMPLHEMLREHNRLNGITFCIVEFALVVVGALFFAYAGIAHDRIWLTAAGADIAINALTVSGIGLAPRRAHEPSRAVRDVFRPSQQGSLPPHAGRHTAAIVVLALTPFAIPAVIALQRLTRRR